MMMMSPGPESHWQAESRGQEAMTLQHFHESRSLTGASRVQPEAHQCGEKVMWHGFIATSGEQLEEDDNRKRYENSEFRKNFVTE
eukprot:3143849-Rhodomonas_salina.1